ncbi:MAG: nucleotidyltransferase [Verrucomicrobiales bacterium]|nr:nucleotidyltransferase [Verrucomicrobiales bacterium]
MQSLADIIKRLHVAGVQFVLVGGIAAVRHGASYLTYDVDICIPLDRENFRKIAASIHDINPRFRQRKEIPFELTDDLLDHLQNLHLITDLGPLDCLGEIKGIGAL